MEELEMMVAIMVASVQDGNLDVSLLQASLLSEGMDEEEISLLIDIISLELQNKTIISS